MPGENRILATTDCDGLEVASSHQKMNSVHPNADFRQCPGCNGLTDSLKSFEFPQVLFLFLHAAHRVENVFSLPFLPAKLFVPMGGDIAPIGERRMASDCIPIVGIPAICQF